MIYLKTIGSQALGAGRNLYFAGLGIAAISSDRTVKVFNGLVEKGRGTVDARQAGPEESSANLKSKITGLGKAAGKRVNSGIDSVLGRLGIPSREEIRNLTRSVEQLTAKVSAVQPKAAD